MSATPCILLLSEFDELTPLCKAQTDMVITGYLVEDLVPTKRVAIVPHSIKLTTEKVLENLCTEAKEKIIIIHYRQTNLG